MTGIDKSWNLEKDAKGVKIYTRAVVGSDFKAYYGITEVGARLATLIALLKDVSTHPKWFDGVIKGENFEDSEPHSYFTHTFAKTPWPVKDRDTVTQTVIKQDEDNLSVICDFSAYPTKRPNHKKYTRIEKLKGQWRFIPNEKGKVTIEYETHVEPGGKIPSVLANHFAIDAPFNTLVGLVNMVDKGVHKSAGYEFIKEPSV